MHLQLDVRRHQQAVWRTMAVLSLPLLWLTLPVVEATAAQDPAGRDGARHPQVEAPPASGPAWEGSLHSAANRNDLPRARQLLAKGADVNARLDGDGMVPLHYAVAHAHREMVELLLEAGADVDATDGDGRSVLAQGAGAVQPEMVRLLLERGASVHTATHYTRFTALMEAANVPRERLAWFGATEEVLDGIVRALLKAGAKVSQASYIGETPLMMAAGEGYAMIAKTLIDAGANVNAQTEVDRFTALMEAAKSGDAETVRVLVQAGADLTQRDRIGRSAVDWGWRYPGVIDQLEKGGADVAQARRRASKLERSVPAEQAELARQALSALGHELTESRWGRVVMEGDLRAIRLFLAAGMSPDAADLAFESPLLRAASGCASGGSWSEIGLELIRAGADPDTKDQNGATALIWAVPSCPVELIQALIDAGADVNARAAGGATPLMMATATGHPEIVALLKAAGAK